MILSAKGLRFVFFTTLLLFISQVITAADGSVPAIAGIRIEFILFAVTLIGVAVFHHKTMHVAVAYVIGFFVLIYTLGWQPHEPHKGKDLQKKVMIQEKH